MSALKSFVALAPGVSRAKEYVIYALVFLFPIAGVGVRHWFSGFFSLLVLVSLWEIFRRKDRDVLVREERIWLWLCVGFFITFVLSGLVNGWGDQQTHSLDKDIRYLALVPLYLMLRQYPYSLKYFILGIAASAIYMSIVAYYEAYVLNHFRVDGVYSPNLVGAYAAMVAVWLLAASRSVARFSLLYILLAVCSAWVVVLSGSRGAFLGMLGMFLVWSMSYFKSWWRIVPVAVVVLLPALLYQFSDRFEARVDEAINAANEYANKIEHKDSNIVGTAVRFEMLRVGWAVFKDNPIFGIGRGNYTEVVNLYIEKSDVSSDVANHGHPHNAYMDTLMSRGLVGFIVFMAMLFYPLYFFIRTYRQSPVTALFGMVQIVGFAVFSLTDASTFIKGNFIAIYLLCMSIFLSRHVALVKQA